ncbi:MAG: hypothetical protein RR340_10645, partial [Cloacibacillus sp.]
MRIRPVTQSDAESICKINDSVKGDKNLHITNSLFMDAESLIENLTALDHMLVLETETEPREICAAVLLIVNRQ